MQAKIEWSRRCRLEQNGADVIGQNRMELTLQARIEWSRGYMLKQNGAEDVG